MPDMFTDIGPFTVRTYTLLLAVGILASAGIAIWRLRGEHRAGAIVDVCLAGLIGGVIAARAVHVLLNWDYFRDHSAEIRHLRAGGLDWHGAVFGALLLMALAAKIRRVRVMALLDALMPALPLMAFMAWWGCGASFCAYGAEVDNLAYYPDWLVWEQKDIYGTVAPRYQTQTLGMALALGLAAIVFVLVWRGWLERRRFWLSLSLLGAGMYLVGFLRADYALVWRDLRADQWLDAAVIAFGLSAFIIGSVGERKRRKAGVVAEDNSAGDASHETHESAGMV